MKKYARPVVDFEDDCTLQMSNKVDLGEILHLDTTGKKIMTYILEEKKKELIKSIISFNKSMIVR